jgi:hypothetical protein
VASSQGQACRSHGATNSYLKNLVRAAAQCLLN